MASIRRWGKILSAGLWASAVAVAQPQRPAPAASAPKPLLTVSVDPRQFGTQDHRITVVSATQFASFASDYNTSVDPVTLSRFCWGFCYEAGMHYYATLDIPAGAVIDYIGVNTSTTTNAVLGFTLWFRDQLGGKANLASFSLPAHGFQTDYAGPLGILVPGNLDRAFVLDVEQAPSLDWQYFGYVEVWWRLVVSDPPATPTFGDVPASHQFYQFIEALAKSGITGGCGGGNYCPESPLTRGQMAAFLSKALGLHWPQ